MQNKAERSSLFSKLAFDAYDHEQVASTPLPAIQNYLSEVYLNVISHHTSPGTLYPKHFLSKITQKFLIFSIPTTISPYQNLKARYKY